MRKKFLTIIIILFFLEVSAQALLESNQEDYKHFYSSNNIFNFTTAFWRGSVIANTQFDKKFQNYYQTKIRDKTTNNIAIISKMFGEGKFVVPICLSLSIIDKTTYTRSLSPIAKFGKRSFRSYLLALPFLYSTQVITGGSRPYEKDYGWKFLNDDNGVSGHALVGAVPFITLAHMSESTWLKKSFFFCSFLTAFSRINDNKHYLSQSFLGWYIAFTASNSVFRKKYVDSRLYFLPFITKNKIEINFNIYY